jgi:hypothetical protein
VFGPDRLDDLLDAQRDLCEDFWLLASAQLWAPAPESIAAADRAEPALVVSGWDGVTHCADAIRGSVLTLVISANDHLHALATLLAEPQRLWAAHTTHRGLLESSARAWFLADTNVNAHERARRLINDTLYSLHELTMLRDKAEASSQHPRRELNQVVASARSLGFSPHLGKGAPQIPPPRPSSTILCSDLLQLPSGLAFRATSGVIHANVMSLLRVAGAEGEIFGALRSNDGAVHLSPEQVVAEYWESVLAYANMALRVAHYFGWSTKDWRNQLQSCIRAWGYM